MSLAAWMPSSLRFFSICLLRAREALSSALMAQPMMIACSGVRRASLLETGEPQPHHHSSSHRWPESHQEPLRASTAGPLRAKMALVAAEPEVSAALAPDHSSRRHPTHSAAFPHQRRQQRQRKAAGIDVRGSSMVARPLKRVASPPSHPPTPTTTTSLTPKPTSGNHNLQISRSSPVVRV